MNSGTDSLIVWTCTHTRTWTAGYNTPIRSDDVYSVTGSSVLWHDMDFDGGDSMTITTPLIVAMDCPWIESGIVTVTPYSITAVTLHDPRVLNYGDGNCDDEAQLTINNHTYNITLH